MASSGYTRGIHVGHVIENWFNGTVQRWPARATVDMRMPGQEPRTRSAPPQRWPARATVTDRNLEAGLCAQRAEVLVYSYTSTWCWEIQTPLSNA